ncbi:DUF1697 domain-containing protein [Heyndrickxia sporothermodurans]
MTIYVALLRGINVGGHNKIKMADLRKSFEALGLTKVKTYIQSGNVLFESNDGEEALRKRIESQIEADFGFSIHVILRTAVELQSILEQCPFSREEIAEAEALDQGESLYVALLLNTPEQEHLNKLSEFRNKKEQYVIQERDIYLIFHDSVRNSKLAINLQKLNVPMTMRNWKTMNKLVALAKEIS